MRYIKKLSVSGDGKGRYITLPRDLVRAWNGCEKIELIYDKGVCVITPLFEGE